MGASAAGRGSCHFFLELFFALDETLVDGLDGSPLARVLRQQLWSQMTDGNCFVSV